MSEYSLDADLLREAIEDDSLSRNTLKFMARMRGADATPAIQEWARQVARRVSARKAEERKP